MLQSLRHTPIMFLSILRTFTRTWCRRRQIAGYEVKQRFYEIGSREGLAELDSLLHGKPSGILS